MKQKKRPLLQLLVTHYGKQYTKDQLTAFIACRNVYADGELSTDPRQLFAEECTLSLSFEQYVSRGGYKLEHALDQFGLSVDGLVMLDAGSSTGGFTDCLLQRGARLVHSVDVGYNQLDWRLRTDERVRVLEKQNIMTLETLDPPPKLPCATSRSDPSERLHHISWPFVAIPGWLLSSSHSLRFPRIWKSSQGSSPTPPCLWMSCSPSVPSSLKRA